MARFKNGWIKVYRKSILGDIGSSFLRQGLFDALVAIANLQSSTVEWRGSPKSLSRGELVTSLQELSELGECDRKTVLRHLNYLALRKTISLERSHSGVLVKINNYEKYQGQDAEGSEVDPISFPNDSQMTPISVPHIEERKKERKKELINNRPKPETPEELLTLVGEKNMSALLNDFDKEILDREFPEIVYYVQNNEKIVVKNYALFVRNWIKRAIKFNEEANQRAMAKQNTMGIKVS